MIVMVKTKSREAGNRHKPESVGTVFDSQRGHHIRRLREKSLGRFCLHLGHETFNSFVVGSIRMPYQIHVLVNPVIFKSPA